MRTSFHGPTYRVDFDEQDAEYFVLNTGADPDDVSGHGSFVFDSVSGDLVDASGAASGRKQSMEWLAFSQDAQDHARRQLEKHGVVVNPYDFASDMPELHKPGAARKKSGKAPQVGRTVILNNPGKCTMCVGPSAEGRITNIDEDGGVHVEWADGSVSALALDDDWVMPPAWNPKDISRTRGVKTMRGPYSARKGYKAWIQRRGKLGEGFLTTMSKKERQKALDACVREWGYFSCKGSLDALARAKTGPRGKGKGVGVRYASKIKASRDYLVKKYGGPGARERDKERMRGKRKGPAAARAAEVGPGYFTNPMAEEHKRRAYGYLREGEEAVHRAMEHFNQAKQKGFDRSIAAADIDAVCNYARDAHQFGELAVHELADAGVSDEEKAEFGAAASTLDTVANGILNRMDCAWK